MDPSNGLDRTEPLKASRVQRLMHHGIEMGSISFWTVFVVFVVLNELGWIVSPPAALALLLLIWTALMWAKYWVAPADTRRMKWFYLACGLLTTVMAALFVVVVLFRQVR